MKKFIVIKKFKKSNIIKIRKKCAHIGKWNLLNFTNSATDTLFAKAWSENLKTGVK